MKKNRKDKITSYASYKRNKYQKILTAVISLVGVIVLSIAFFSGQLQVDIDTFLGENGISLFGLMKAKDSENVILAQEKICYDLYTVPDQSKGIYIPSKKVDNIREYIAIAKETDINSFVIDVKDDNGNLTFATDNEALKAMGIVQKKPPIEDIDKVINKMNEAGIYAIARIVVFKDNVYTKSYPESAVKDLEGSSYVTSAGDRWLDPYNKENWEYILAICDEACKHGFKEIQFDYVRFHESMNETTATLDENKSKTEIITEFIKYMSEELHKRNVKVSADVFGTVVLSDIDADIVGQDFVEMSRYLDFISPMIYPSHYAEGTFGIEYPHMDAYDVILKTLRVGQKRLEENGVERAKMRPWMQDFTLSAKKPYLEYGPEEIKEQIQGANDAGIYDWLFWNAAGNYTKAGLRAG